MGLTLQLLSGSLDQVLPVLNKWRGALLDFLRFPLLGAGTLREGVAVPVAPASVLVSFDGKGAPRKALVFNIRGAAPAAVVQVPAQQGDRGLRLSATAACTVDVWMVA